MTHGKLPAPISQADYDTIEAAVMETERGRWFLSEYARRNRHADTERVLGAIEKLHHNLQRQRTEARLERMRLELVEMARAIAITHVEIGRIRPQGLAATRLNVASGELNAIVRATEEATSSILSAAEQVQQQAWTMRELGAPEAHCDNLDACATEIYAACGFQDITAQRTQKVIETLNYVEGRIKQIMQAWNVESPAAASEPTGQPASFWPDDAGRQERIDRMLELPDAEPPAGEPQPRQTSAPARTGAMQPLDDLPTAERLRLFS
ncbi:MAG TPA: hypothetical protein PK812_04275 [Beijerinckiaceae bacterium]|nr:hypothetical protein [Beijerinckiaceae bacterium]